MHDVRARAAAWVHSTSMAWPRSPRLTSRPTSQRTALPSATSNPSRSARHRCRSAAKIKARTLICRRLSGSGGNALPPRAVLPARRTSQEHQLPLSTCHVRSGPWTTWSVTGPDRTVAPRPWRLASRQPRAGTPATPPWRANQAAAATGAGWPPRSDTRDNANADPLGQAELAGAAVTGTAAD